MKSRNNLQLTDGQSLSNVVASNFSKLTEEQKNSVLMQYNEEQRRGKLDKFFGDKCVQTYIAFIICILVLIIGVTINICEYKASKTLSMDIWSIFTPIITLALGYMFGKK